MWKLIDFYSYETDLGYTFEIDNYYKVKNMETGEIRTLDEYEFYNFKRLGLIK